jgi:hypothetical protein
MGVKKYLNVTMNLDCYACALHEIFNLNSYVYYLMVDLLVSKVTTSRSSSSIRF